MTYEIKYFPIEQFAYMRRIGAYGEENYALMADLKDWANSQHLLNENTVIYGIARDNPNSVSLEKCRYDVGIVVDEKFKETDDINIGIVSSGGKYLVFTIEHTPQEVNKFWISITTAMNNCGEELDTERSILERYEKKLIDKGFCEICVPIK